MQKKKTETKVYFNGDVYTSWKKNYHDNAYLIGENQNSNSNNDALFHGFTFVV